MQMEIVDETDVYEDVNVRNPRKTAKNVDLDGFLAMMVGNPRP